MRDWRNKTFCGQPNANIMYWSGVDFEYWSTEQWKENRLTRQVEPKQITEVEDHRSSELAERPGHDDNVV